MPVLVRIALRNLIEHKSKSLIIGIIMAFGIMILVVGNSFIDTSAQGIRRAFIDNFTGDVMISGKTDGQISLFGVQSVSGIERTPLIPDYSKVTSYVAGQKNVESHTPQVSGFATIGAEGNNDMQTNVFSILFGIEPGSYHKMFDNIDLVSGSYLKPGETGIMLSQSKVKEIDKQLKTHLRVGDKLLLNSLSNVGFHIRVVPVRAIFTFKQKTGALDSISYVDIDSLRALLGLVVGTTPTADLAHSETSLLGSNNADNLFGGGGMVQEDTSGTTTNNVAGLSSALASSSGSARAPQTDSGAWNYILIHLKDSAQAPGFIANMNMWFDQQGIAAQAQDWKAAADGFASSSDIIRIVFNVAIIIVAIVAIIIIMNTLVISVIERTSEIGMMRALGAQKGFIWRMFVAETLTVSIVFGLIGIALGSVVIGVIDLLGIHITNEFLQILFAGPVLHPSVSVSSLISSLVVVVLVGILSHLYPVSIALKVQPVRAIQTD